MIICIKGGSIMKETLIVVDMQNDFINGSLGSKEAQAIVPNVAKRIQSCRQADNFYKRFSFP